jgi:MFS family permease
MLCLVTYTTSYADQVADGLAGSRLAYLVVLPVLAVLIAAGYRTTSHGVGDGESDWIVAALFGILGLAAIHLLVGRMPTLSAWWRLESLSVLVWAVCCVIILFGMRHALKMWSLWVFIACFATPVPYLAATAALGGTETAAGLVAAAIGAVAVFLATRTTQTHRRLLAAAISFASGAVLAYSCAAWFLPSVIVAAGVVPVLVVIGARLAPNRQSADRTDRPIGAGMPHRSARTVGVLAAATAVLVAAGWHDPGSTAQRSVPADWAARIGLAPVESYGFVTRLAGPGATLVRYAVPAEKGMPSAAVDILSTPNGAVLDDLSDVVWYPTARPVSYRAAPSAAGIPAGTRAFHSDADAAADASSREWYALSWTQRSGPVSQRVTVIVSQSLSGDEPPPAPQPPDLLDASVGSWLWLSRQQPQGLDHVDPLVSKRATTVAATIGGVRETPSPGGKHSSD